jgi:hypothetical protein
MQSLSDVAAIPWFKGNATLSDNAARLGLSLDPANPETWRSALLAEAGRVSAERASHLADRPQPGSDGSIGGTGDANRPVTATALFEAAAMSYLGADGRAAAGFLQSAVDTGDLTPPLRAFAETSIKKLDNPGLFGDALGIFLLQVNQGRFTSARLQANDTIVLIDGEPANEINQLTTALIKPEGVMLTVIRDAKEIEITVTGTGPAGAGVTQLVILHAQQI